MGAADLSALADKWAFEAFTCLSQTVSHIDAAERAINASPDRVPLKAQRLIEDAKQASGKAEAYRLCAEQLREILR